MPVRFHAETQFQIGLVGLLRRTLKPEIVFWHTPNEGIRSKREAGKLAAMGLLPGVADLQFLLPNRPPLFLELKQGDNDLTKVQRAFRDDVIALGCNYSVAYSYEAAIASLRPFDVFRRDVEVMA